MVVRFPPSGFMGRVGIIGGTPASALVLSCSCRSFIEHSSDPKRWWSPAKAEVKRRHPGVRLGSEFARIREQGELEQQLVDADRFTDWNMVSGFAIGAAILLVFLNVIMEMVEPNSPPEYTPFSPFSELHKRDGEE
ncbi:hypothetical protein C3747_47g1289c [Trypanosoma cruzi]|uniref:Uncharacterized protein n=2 Tax=Trypanosoma cruzi TaxID=5693 RepID=Q4CY84_TRYCC|nr:hypothetical protein, conserved [Trypanosoma cruzi]EAN85238.1 hypothetical protein, conserved [Trypanosoma cruzi]PWV12836.1 hypothetical protein C3747_47g1289c [Trypanosoma cruzi]RNC44146.1 hypothetical protein TcCL_NonESM06165 [Trypanosoma cruzi]|eukprot:XP_807089.1 hypothetical protein [Trypanosoma cruzi strain CL Brener]